MSSGWSEYVVESAEARERRLLAAAIARRDGLLSDLAGVTGELRSLGLPAIAGFGPAPGTSEEVEAQCGKLQRLISEARSGIEKELARRQQDTARRQLAEAISGFVVSPEIAAGNHRQSLRTKLGIHHGRDTGLPKTLYCCEEDRRVWL